MESSKARFDIFADYPNYLTTINKRYKMIKTTLLTLSSLILLAGCNAPDHKAKSPENTGINSRDSTGHTLTSGDQSETEADRTITQNVRKAIIADSSLSVLAKNIKIVTNRGVVTLRGPVNSENEKESIGNKAMQVQGVTRVDNQLEVNQTPGAQFNK
jgi:hypothetical protein